MIDEFYCDLYPILFQHWVLSNQKEYKKNNINVFISKVDHLRTEITFESNNLIAYVTIWQDDDEIVEQEIFDKENHELLFYLHFRLTKISQFRNLFLEFYNTFIKLNNTKTYSIAFVCSNGLSTSLFVDELLQVCKLQKLDYEITSLSFDKLKEKDYQFDAIYLAPQISYLLPKLLQETKNKIPIYKIDPTIFATKDYQGILKIIDNNLKG
jgi:cellobiose-specific phosphotransferase system component IIB